MSFALLMLAAMLVEAVFGWPHRLFRIIRHPVVWIGAYITLLERRLNRDHHLALRRRFQGAVAMLVVVTTVAAIAVVISTLLPNKPWAYVIEVLLASSLIATRSLYVHVLAVASTLGDSDLNAARSAVRHIVGRDPEALDAAGLARASIESLAENASDGVVAPIFWGAFFGLPGIAAYKAINTLDSMIGHRNSRYEDFGWSSARFDDLVNWIPARLTALLFVVVSDSRTTMRTVFADARLHRSPNAGWPESALAGAIGVRISGPRSYAGQHTNEPWVNGRCPDPDSVSVRRGLKVYLASMSLLALLLLVISYLLFPR